MNIVWEGTLSASVGLAVLVTIALFWWLFVRRP